MNWKREELIEFAKYLDEGCNLLGEGYIESRTDEYLNNIANKNSALVGQERNVALCWSTKKRHIAVDGEVLCEPKHKTNGYSVKNGGYNSLSLTGIPKHHKMNNDIKGSHGDGIIPFLPLEDQPLFINTKSVCIKCLNKYESLWK